MEGLVVLLLFMFVGAVSEAVGAVPVVTTTCLLLPSPQRFQLLVLTAGLSYSKYGLPLHLFPAAS